MKEQIIRKSHKTKEKWIELGKTDQAQQLMKKNLQEQKYQKRKQERATWFNWRNR